MNKQQIEEVKSKFDFVINMWKDSSNEMDGIHTLQTLKKEVIDALSQPKDVEEIRKELKYKLQMAIERKVKLAEDSDSAWIVGEDDAADKCVEIITPYLQPQQSESKWISVEDELPKQNEGFYICLGFTSSGYETIKVAFNCLTKQFQTMNFEVIHKLITHWMPLPNKPTI